MSEAKMFNPVRPSDILSVKAWWSNIKLSNSKPNVRLVTIKGKNERIYKNIFQF